MSKAYKDSWDYELYITYTSVEDLNQTIDEIIDYMGSEADSRNGFIEYDITCDELDFFGKKLLLLWFLSRIVAIGHLRNCFTESEAMCDELGLSW